ncbi:DUF1566 domain-containing protein [Pseudomonas corrugata]|uniref:DUF1566 domain-containing protein n=1 Tax=Pseudomonas corrugata TaxID=47879 RepID=UPI003D812951
MSATAQAVPAVSLPTIGQAYGGGYVTGITRDPETGKRYLNITAGAQHELVGAWGKYGEKIEGADSFTNSRANTEAMAAAGSELAQKVLALDIGGFTDWAIPARDVQELQYRYFKPTTEENWQYGRSGDNPNSEPVGLLYTEESPTQTSIEAFQEGGPEAFQDRAYWSSSQRSAYGAFGMGFDDGIQFNFAKYSELRVRPVRRVLTEACPFEA